MYAQFVWEGDARSMAIAPPGPRRYKSRKARPCDFCRNRKAACHMEQGPPCRLCRERHRDCTFVQAPSRRKRPFPAESATERPHRPPPSTTNTPPRTPLTAVSSEGGVDDDSLPSAAAVGMGGAESLPPHQRWPMPAQAWPTELDPSYRRPSDTGPDMTTPGLPFDTSGQDGRYSRSSTFTPNLLLSRGISYLDDAISDIFTSSLPPCGLPFAASSIGGTHAATAAMPEIGGTEAQAVLAAQFPPTTVSTGGPCFAPAQAPPDIAAVEAQSLEAVPGISYRMIGDTGDLDLYLLRHRQYDYHDESPVTYRGIKFRRMSQNPAPHTSDSGTAYSPNRTGPDGAANDVANVPPIVFAVADKELLDRAEPRLLQSDIEQAREELRTLISPSFGYRLLLLYAHYVHPHYPVLAARQLPRCPADVLALPAPLLAVVCATALPFVTYDDVLSAWVPHCPSGSDLLRLCWVLVSEELHTPRLTTIQTVLLMLQRHATNRYMPNTPFRPVLMGLAVSLCHCLGLHRDPTRWQSLPAWERRLRRRLWWATWMMDTWTGLGESVPPALQDQDADVSPLRIEDLVDEDDLEGGKEAVLAAGLRGGTAAPPLEFESPVTSHFSHLVELTGILRRVMDTFFTVRASARMATDLDASLEAAKPLRRMLKIWHDGLPADLRSQASPSTEADMAGGTRGSGGHGSGSGRKRNGQRARQASLCRLDASGSFYLAYLAVQLTLFRALLRPVSMLATLSDGKHAASAASSEGEENEDVDCFDDAEYINGGSSSSSSSSLTDSAIPPRKTSAIRAIIVGAMAVMEEVVQFAENLGGSEWDAFWHSWSRTNFAIVACVMLNLVFILRPPMSPARAQEQARPQAQDPVQGHLAERPIPAPASLVSPSLRSPQPVPPPSQTHNVHETEAPQPPNTASFLGLQDEYKALLDHLTRWRWAMKISSRGAGGLKGLMNLSLLRLDALLSELSCASPHETVEEAGLVPTEADSVRVQYRCNPPL
ncbi:Transcription factor [Niveomyces insectorum RCEF 264]|uniref:Transcription factor n=1 Tax=Niveomyces insectorum RCEF 264 TaxID=1081102 RepID=A0A167NRY6_9HYPO|nr:Transcription factor [Niveomyces insectorum RCEF 264]